MKKWLEDDPTQQLTKELQIWMDNGGFLDDAGLKGSKGKAKAKDTTGGQSGSGEEKKKKKKKTISSAR